MCVCVCVCYTIIFLFRLKKLKENIHMRSFYGNTFSTSAMIYLHMSILLGIVFLIKKFFTLHK